MANVNVCVLAGNLTRDPEPRKLPSGQTVCTLGLAVSRKWTSKEGEKREKVCFVDVEVFGKQADSVVQYCKKGMGVIVEGELEYDVWEKDGEKRAKHKINANRVTFLSSPAKKENLADDGQDVDGN